MDDTSTPPPLPPGAKLLSAGAVPPVPPPLPPGAKSISAPTSATPPSAWEYLTDEKLPGGGRFDILGYLAKKGQSLNDAVQRESGRMAEAAGRQSANPRVLPQDTENQVLEATAFGTAGEFVIPRNRLGVALSVIPMSIGIARWLRDVPEATKAVEGMIRAEGSASALKMPTRIQKAIASFASMQSTANPKHLAAVLANPEIMDEATPSMREVGKEYQEVFKRLGQKFDSATYREITGERYAPRNDAQVSKYQRLLSDAANKLDDLADPLKKEAEKLTVGEAFLARSAGKKILDTAQGLSKTQMARDIDRLDEFLINNGIPELKTLSQKYFRAAAKESMSQIIPRNKNMSPNAVRGLLMMKYGADAAQALAEGHPLQAAIRAGTAAAMSPAVQGAILPKVLGGPSSAMVSAASQIPTAAANLAGLSPAAQNILNDKGPTP